jgi:hypothetical protein
MGLSLTRQEKDWLSKHGCGQSKAISGNGG